MSNKKNKKFKANNPAKGVRAQAVESEAKAELAETVVPTSENFENVEITETNANAENANKKDKKNGKVVEVKAKDVDKKKKKKEKIKKPRKLAKAIKDTGSELKRVTWPKFSQVVKQTGVVLAVVIIFALVLLGLDKLCSLLVGLIY